MKITSDQNFCRVFEMPESYPKGFCFGGGKPCEFLMVDWFQPIVPEKVREDKDFNWPDEEAKLIAFLKEKMYLKAGRTYLLVTDFGKAFTFQK